MSTENARKIIHVDMDAFYASVEQRDFPDRYAGKPIAVGGGPPRGVVMTASYEARPYGIHSAQPSAEAKRLCPDLIFVKPRMDVYRDVSRRIRSIFERYTDLIEPLSLDEAYLDVTEPKQGPPSGTLIARQIRAAIAEETGLTASAGVAPGKFLAKVASDRDKPDGLTVVTPGEVMDFIASLEIQTFHGVGPVTAERMQAIGVHTGADLQAMDESELVKHFGRRGHFFYRMAHGRDTRPVRPNRTRKSVGAERTFRDDVDDPAEMMTRLEPLADRVMRRMERAKRRGRTVTLKLKSFRHEVSTRQVTLDRYVRSAPDLLAVARRLLHDPHPPRDPVRLLGLSVSSLNNPTAETYVVQMELPFPEG
jgi:DNA polymerase-4